LAVIAALAISTACPTADRADARTAGVSSPPHAVAPPGRARGAVGTWRGHAARHGAARRARSHFGGPGFGADIVEIGAEPMLYEEGMQLAPGCHVRRLQFSDLYWWRVRTVVVCP
jgi:hypothetical protein